ncbi:hypothetical protein DYB35_007893 [Aphanomyces astaci]|uniref:Aldehyde oxidase/xanthine dehydrogenase a/b hammerhead domain-containing protein n=1 Tax=Aphanomyces astaci TaxID=112090 RepID=A0A418DG60_APHAT|nr:hypothetical protein DYB35_007893 [Aphanomyces astaci]
MYSSFVKLLATGEAKYVADVPPIPGMLYGALVFSTQALANLVQLDTLRARQVAGVVDVVTAADIPGTNAIGDGLEPLFVPLQGQVLYVGMALGLVLATSASVAQHAAGLVVAEAAGTLVPSTPDQPNPIPMPGNDDHVDEKIATAPRQLQGTVSFGSQRHFYMEPQASTVYPDEDRCYRVETSTQNPTGVQAAVAGVLGVSLHAVDVKMKRAGGGFGGKLTRCNVNATAAAIAAHKHDVGLHASADVARRKEAAVYFNSQNKWKKRGLAVTPVKYGIAISGLKYGASVSIFHGDGTVLVTHGGCEIGQGIDTKAAQMAAFMLGIPLAKIKLQPTSTGLIPNSDATGGSSTSESIARSVQAACQTLITRLSSVRTQLPKDATWGQVVAAAHADGVQLFASEQPNVVAPPLQVFDYFVYAAACSEVEVDILTGEVNVLRTDIMYDCGKSFNPVIDIGQIEGAFVMALGLFFQESVEYDAAGRLLTSGTWEYKVPSHKDIPEVLNVTLLDKSDNPRGVMSSKAVGEPPFQLVNSVYFALKNALRHSRLERNVTEFFQLDMPATVDRRLLAAKVQPAELQL